MNYLFSTFTNGHTVNHCVKSDSLQKAKVYMRKMFRRPCYLGVVSDEDFNSYHKYYLK